MHELVEVLQWIAIGIICIGYPILMFFTIWALPVYVIISYFVWIVCMVGWISFSKKKKISEYIFPIAVMVLIFTYVYALGYSDENFDDTDWVLVWLSPALSTPAYCYIGYKIAEYRRRKKIVQMKIMINSLNEYYRKRIEGINKIIRLIDKKFSDRKQIAYFLNLLDKCSGSELALLYSGKAFEQNSNLLVEIKKIALEYAFSNEIEKQTLMEIYEKMKKLKVECRNKIRTEKAINIEVYKSIKREYFNCIIDSR